jgi:hypothetical protein
VRSSTQPRLVGKRGREDTQSGELVFVTVGRQFGEACREKPEAASVEAAAQAILEVLSDQLAAPIGQLIVKIGLQHTADLTARQRASGPSRREDHLSTAS